ncbi:MAG TPA: alpha-D-ribose 1-methylphosphonate 5-triphosphate diphosphatase [Chloroflexota bacterium]
MPGDLLIRRARAVLPDRVLPGADVLVRGGTIAAVAPSPLDEYGPAILDAAGQWLLPGLIDVHCDAIEKEAQPRPGVRLPFEVALRELDRKLALCGITTMFHGVSFGAGEGVRDNRTAAELVRAIAAFGEGDTLVRHRAHLRFELSNWSALDLVADLLDEGAVGLLSFMDHTPGQGQYRDPARFREYVRKTFWVGEEEIDRIVQEKHEGRSRVGEAHVRALADRASAAGVPLAGHDPDSAAAIDLAVERGVGLVEFPIGLEVAMRATERGLRVCVGAPNVLRGRSHDGNLSARDAIAAGAADVLCSDYYPAGLLAAVFALVGDCVLDAPAAVAMATSSAAAVVGLEGFAGAIRTGRRADLLLVSTAGGYPAVEATIVGGEVVLTAAGRGAPRPRDPAPRRPVAARPC